MSLAQIVCARIFCRVDSKYIGRKFQNSFAHGCTDDLPIVGRFTKIASVHYSIPLLLRIPPQYTILKLSRTLTNIICATVLICCKYMYCIELERHR
jgi:hypothetical protein